MSIVSKNSIQEIIVGEYEKSQKNIQEVWIGEGWYKTTPNSFNYFVSGFEAGIEFSKQQNIGEINNALTIPMTKLDNLLESVFVLDPGFWENDIGPKDWYAVGTDNDGIIAYFFKESDAYRFRLDYINRQLTHNLENN